MSQRRAAMAAAGALAAALVCAFTIAAATDPPAVFPKYLAAAAAPAAEQNERLQDYSPLYLAGARLLAPLGYRALLVVQGVLHGLTAAAVAAAVSLLAGAGWGFAAGLVVAAYRPFLVYCGIHEPESLVLAALAVAVLGGLLARRHEGPRAWVAAAFAGAALAAAALARPQHLALLPVWVFWMVGRETAPRRRRDTRVLVGVTLVAAALALAPFVIARASGGFGVGSIMNPGAVFYEGNGPGATGLVRFAPPAVVALEQVPREAYDYGHVAYRRVAASALDWPSDTAPAAATNRYWRGLAWEAIRADPARALARAARKTALALAPYEAHDLAAAEQLDRRLRPRLPVGFFLPLLGLTWIALASRERRRDLLGPLAIAALAFIVQVVLYASARQRLPLALALLVAGPVLAADLGRGRLTKVVRPALAVGLGLAVALAATALSARHAVLDQLGWDGELAREPTSIGSRLAAWQDGRALRPELARSARRLLDGATLASRGRPQEALRALAPLVGRRIDWTANDKTVGVPEYWVARAFLALGARAPAAAAATEAASIRPDDPRVRALALRLGRPPHAAEPAAWRPEGSDPVSAALARATAARADGDPAAADALLRPLTARFPDLVSP